MQLHVRDLHLRLRHPFTTAHGTLREKHNLLVELQEHHITGLGEAAPSLAYPEFNAERIAAALREIAPELASIQFRDPQSLWEQLAPKLRAQPFALCAIDLAAHDLWGKRLGVPVWKAWGLRLENLPVSNFTIGLAPIEEMVAKLREASDWPVYKIKLGGQDDLDVMRELRRHTAAPFRVDANTGWTAEQTIAYAPALRDLGVEFIEQPLPAGDWEGMARVRAECALPVIADESCQTEADVDRCAQVFHGINLKLTKAGGLTPARRMIARARELGLKVMAGCMIESGIAISGLAQLLPLLDAVDMDGAALLAEDPVDGVQVIAGKAIFPDAPGLGARLRSV
jgi:L-alanine-DL-glutamate epimerase-like enolase superfamily enzyme